jgi:membrane protein implicated in regulation of membrane protease activity
MKTAGTISISVALRSTAVAAFGLVLMFMTSVQLSLLTLAILPVLLLAFRTYAVRGSVRPPIHPPVPACLSVRLPACL